MLSPVTIASTRCEYASGAARRARTASGSRTVVVDGVEHEGRLGLEPLELGCRRGRRRASGRDAIRAGLREHLGRTARPGRG